MKKLTLSRTDSLTFGEGCEKYLDNCRQRNLRKGTINHYRQSYTQFFKYFDPDMPVAEFNKAMYDDFVLHLQEVLCNDISINSYLRDLITTLHFLMGEGYVQHFILLNVGSQVAGSAVALKDADGNVLFSHEAELAFSCVILSIPEIRQGETYTLSAGSYTAQITMTSTVYGSSGGMGGMGGFGGNPGGNRPGGGKRH